MNCKQTGSELQGRTARLSVYLLKRGAHLGHAPGNRRTYELVDFSGHNLMMHTHDDR